MYDSLPENNRKSTVSVDNGEEPRFLQIAARIRSLITAGDLEAHTALRSERVLAEEQGVSRMTARHALEARETEGLIYSADRRGRILVIAAPRALGYNAARYLPQFEQSGAAPWLRISTSM